MENSEDKSGYGDRNLLVPSAPSVQSSVPPR